MHTSQLRHRFYRLSRFAFKLNRFYRQTARPVIAMATFALALLGMLITAYEIGSWYFCLLDSECVYHLSGLMIALVFTFLSAFVYTLTY